MICKYYKEVGIKVEKEIKVFKLCFNSITMVVQKGGVLLQDCIYNEKSEKDCLYNKN